MEDPPMSPIRHGDQFATLEESEPARTETASARANSLQAVYETDPEVIAAVLPRPLAAGRLNHDA
jgi:hypothetical protein